MNIPKYPISGLICVFVDKSYEKRIRITIWVEQYERNNERVRSRFSRQMKSKRQSTVEPVWGTLTQFMGLRKINTIGIKQANKVMHLAATAYNLKKLLKFITTKVETAVGVISPELALKAAFLWFFRPCLTSETLQN